MTNDASPFLLPTAYCQLPLPCQLPSRFRNAIDTPSHGPYYPKVFIPGEMLRRDLLNGKKRAGRIFADAAVQRI